MEGGVEVSDIESLIPEAPPPDVGRRAEWGAASGRLVRIADDPPVYVFMGEHGDHIVVGGVYCSCEAFKYSLLRGRPGCYHVYAARLHGGLARRISAGRGEVESIIYEVVTAGFSPTLRRLIYVDPER